MMRAFTWNLGVLLAIMLGSGLAIGQTTGTVTGTVTDPQGGAVVGAEVTISNALAGINQTAVTDAAGDYQFLLLQPGTYVLEAKFSGFRTFRRAGILVEGNRSQAVPIALQIGQVADTVEVSAGAVLLEANSATVGTVMDTQKIQDLPLNGRNPEGLANLIPTVRGLVGGVGGRFGGPVTKTFSTGLVVIGGGSPISNGTLMDGVPNDKAGQAPGMMTHLAADATQEFKVLTNSFSAEYGRSGGGIISVVSKSGTNEYHAVASDYLRNTVFDANGFFANSAGQPRPVLKINQWTGVLGGPIKKDKLFFFTNYEGYAERRATNRIITSPTTLQRTGDFSQTRAANGALIVIYDPLTTIPNPAAAGAYIRTAFPNNTIPPTRITKIAQSTFALLAQPNLPGVAVTNINNLAQTGTQPTDRWVIGNKVDYNITQQRRLAVRYTLDVVDWTYPNYFGNVLETEGRHNHIPRNSASLGYTDVLTPTLLLDFKMGYNRDNEVAWCPFDEAKYGANLDLVKFGYPQSFADTVHRDKLSTRGKWPQYVISDTNTLAGCNSNFRAGSALAGNIGVTKIKGGHTVKTGYQLVQYMDNTGGGGFAGTIFRFDRGFTQGPNPNTASTTAGFGTASFLLGDTSNTTSSVSPFQAQQAMVQLYHSLYVQDDWKATRKLTLNLGLRWEYEAPITDRFNQFTNFDPYLPSPLKVPGFNLKGGATFGDVNDKSRQGYTDAIFNHFAPRFGFAYQATAKWVVRGGYGINWIPTKGTPIYQSAGFRVANPMISSIDGGLKPFNTMNDPYPGGVPGPTGNSRGALTEVGSDFYGLLRNVRPGYAQQGNFTVQYQPWNNWLFEGAYLMNHGLRLMTMQSINYNQLEAQYLPLGNALNTAVANPSLGIITSGPLSGATVARQQLLRPYPQYNNVFGNYDFLGNSIYHALTIKVEKRLSNGLSLLAAYAKSKIIDSASYNAAVVNWYNLSAERSRGAQDTPQRLVLTALYELPFAKKATGWQKYAVGGWHLNAIATMQSGGTLALTAGGIAGRPNVVAGMNPKLDNQTLGQWFNTAAYSVPAAFTYGNASRTIPNVSGPGLRTVDFSIFKDFVYRERYKLQFRAEAFNVLNTPNFANPGVAVGTANFGVVTGDGNILPREMQLSLRFSF